VAKQHINSSAQGMDANKHLEHEFELVRNTSVPVNAPKGDIENAPLTEGHETSAAIQNSPWQASQRKALAFQYSPKSASSAAMHRERCQFFHTADKVRLDRAS